MSGIEYADEILEPVELREYGHETVILSVGNLNLAENTVHQSPGFCSLVTSSFTSDAIAGEIRLRETKTSAIVTASNLKHG